MLCCCRFKSWYSEEFLSCFRIADFIARRRAIKSVIILLKNPSGDFRNACLTSGAKCKSWATKSPTTPAPSLTTSALPGSTKVSGEMLNEIIIVGYIEEKSRATTFSCKPFSGGSTKPPSKVFSDPRFGGTSSPFLNASAVRNASTCLPLPIFANSSSG